MAARRATVQPRAIGYERPPPGLARWSHDSALIAASHQVLLPSPPALPAASGGRKGGRGGHTGGPRRIGTNQPSTGPSPVGWSQQSPCTPVNCYPGERHRTDTYRHAIANGCHRAFPPPGLLAQRDGEAVAKWRKRLTRKQKRDLAAWRSAHRPGTAGVPWPDGRHPHQPWPAKPWRRRLRHTCATPVRKQFALEAAQILLGHTQRRCDADLRRAADEPCCHSGWEDWVIWKPDVSTPAGLGRRRPFRAAR